MLEIIITITHDQQQSAGFLFSSFFFLSSLFRIRFTLKHSSNRCVFVCIRLSSLFCIRLCVCVCVCVWFLKAQNPKIKTNKKKTNSSSHWRSAHKKTENIGSIHDHSGVFRALVSVVARIDCKRLSSVTE
jgi:hypothetical protein